MSDVEKYGLVAVVFVGGLLLVIATQGGFGGDDSTLAPEVIDTATPLRAPAPGSGAGAENKMRVVSVLPDTPFQWDEPPVPYPGRRSVSQPGASVPSAETSSAGAPLASTAAPAPRALPGTHVIAKGETLSDIADQYLGSTTRWKELLPLNPGLDPKKLQVGQVVRVSGLPPVTPETSVPPPAAAPPPLASVAPAAKAGSAAKAAPAGIGKGKGRTHTVAKGDTLGAIAKKYLGSATLADEIYKANTNVLKTKDDLAVGQVLRIP